MLSCPALVSRRQSSWGALLLGTVLSIGGACQTTERGNTKRTTDKNNNVTKVPTGGATVPADRLLTIDLDGNTVSGRKLEVVQQGPWQSRGVGVGNEDRELERMDSSAMAEGAPPSSMPPPPPPPPSMPMPAPAHSIRLSDGDSEGGGKRVAVGRLKAGSTDDNAAFEAFMDFLGQWRGGIDDPLLTSLDVSDRRTIEVVDTNGRPVPGVQVEILDAKTETLVWRATTYGDGRAPYYPRVHPAALSGVKTSRQAHEDSVLVVLRKDEWSTSVALESTASPLRIVLEDPPATPQTVPIDVTFVIDTTGSMSDEIERIRASLLKVTERVQTTTGGVDVRYGAVLYRDLGDAYVTSRHPFTNDVTAFDEALQGVQAGGGGDFPESMNQGLLVAVDQMQWRQSAAKVVFLIADAPPHTDYEGDIPYQTSSVRAVENGIRVHAVAASGLNDAGTLAMRQIAQATRGKFIFIEYGAPGETAKSHGVANPSSSNNLDDILFKQIRDEVEGFGKTTR